MKRLLALSLTLTVLSCSPQQVADSLKASPSPAATVSVSPTPQQGVSVSARTAITEAQVKKDKMVPDEDDTIVVDLENKDVTAEEDDTGTLGEDIIPVNYTQDINGTIKWEGTKNGNYLELKDKDGNVIYKLEQGGDAVTKDIKKGEYTIEITSNETTVKDGSTSESVFIRVQDNLSVSGNLWHLMWAVSNSCSKCCLSSGYYPNANFAGRDFSYSDFWHATLYDAILSNANLSQAYLEGANLSRATLINANLSNANLSGANLNNADLGLANLSNANFSGANLNNARFHMANLSGANFTNANLAGAILHNSYLGANFTGANFTGTNLDAKKFSGLNCSNANFTGATLRASDFSSANLQSANLQGTNLDSTHFKSANLKEANLTGAQNIQLMYLDKADLSGATWTDGRKCKEGSIGDCK